MFSGLGDADVVLFHKGAPRPHPSHFLSSSKPSLLKYVPVIAPGAFWLSCLLNFMGHFEEALNFGSSLLVQESLSRESWDRASSGFSQ